jgi:predicted TIM-barrel fold metal-dependent hydrolase
VVPYPEDDTVALAEALGGTDALVMGSDWPHAEGLREPAEMYSRVEGLGGRRQHFLRDNGLDLLTD